VIWLVPLVHAGSVSEPEASELARSFYRACGKPVPEAFLADDVDALLESGRSLAELERAVPWIARSVDGACRYTLAGILESHLASALNEEEELVVPEGFDAEAVLAEVEQVELWQPSPSDVAWILETFYTGTGRTPPSPPLEQDLAWVDTLARDGWTREAVRTLAAWIPANVLGAELLTWGEAARVAKDNGYMGGPRPNGQLRGLQGVSEPLLAPREAWIVDRVPERHDGGHLLTVATLGGLQGNIDRAAHPAELPGLDLRALSATGGLGLEGADLGLQVAQSSAAWGLSVAGGVSGAAPGQLDTHGLALDGGFTRRVQGPPISGRHAYGRAGIAKVTPAITGARVVLGVGGYGYRGLEQAQGGGLVSARFGEDLHLLAELGMGGHRGQVQGEEVVGPRVTVEVAPGIDLGPWSLQARWRLDSLSGGLLEDDGDIVDDWYRERWSGGELIARRAGERGSVALGLCGEIGGYDLSWVERGDVDSEHQLQLEGSELQALLAGDARLLADSELWIYGGLLVSGGDLGRPGVEAGAGVRYLLVDRLWLEAAARAGRDWTGQAGVTLPF
jgi:hypothetical protein